MEDKNIDKNLNIEDSVQQTSQLVPSWEIFLTAFSCYRRINLKP